MRLFIAAAAAFFLISPAFADSQGSATGGTAGTQSTGAGCIDQSPSLSSGQQATLSCDSSGNLKTSTSLSPAQRTIITLDVKTVTTGATAVTAIATGHRTAGGFLQNPIGATVALCINEIGTASGTTSSGDTTCIQPGQTYNAGPPRQGALP